MADLRARDAIAARALEFLILTNVRTDTVVKAAWDEFDLDQAVWTVPLANLKDRNHRKEGFRVPLVARAVEIVRQMDEGRISRFVFPGQARGKPLSNMALLTLLKRLNSADDKKWIDPVSGRRITAHGSGQPSGHGRKRSRRFRTLSSSRRWGIRSGLKLKGRKAGDGGGAASGRGRCPGGGHELRFLLHEYPVYQNIVLALLEAAGTGCSTSQCSTILPLTSNRKISTPAVSRPAQSK